MSSRGWAIALGIGAIVLAGLLLVVYLNRYRARVSSANTPTPVLVAKRLIREGTPGSIITSQAMYEAPLLAKQEVDVGAIDDPQMLAGLVAAEDILPGQQLTTDDFVTGGTTSSGVVSQITGTQRALSVSIDNVHGSLSQVQAGDAVDVYTSVEGEVCLFHPNVMVLAIPTTAGPSGNGNLVLRVESRDAADFAYAADHTQLWFVLRPVAGAKPSAPRCGDLQTVTRSR
jgi:Flp pilus assembly protein CpaB